MKITNKSIQPTVKEALLELKVKVQCLQFISAKKAYVRSQIFKIKKEKNSYSFKTKIENGYILVWRMS